jgi:hypothetical protein
MGIFATRKAKVICPILEDGSYMKPWQKQFCNIYELVNENGTILYIYDKKGRSGKSKLCDWIYLYKDRFFVMI